MTTGVQVIDIDWRGRATRIEYQWLGEPGLDGVAPTIVFLHEGLGSVAMWKDFPARLVDALGVSGLVYSRPAYGASTARAADDHWAPDFLHRQAHEVLPAVLHALGVTRPVDLFGHSDGGSIALLYAAAFPDQVARAMVLAPHILVEDISVRSIEQARNAYVASGDGGLRAKLARYHQDVDSAFWGWCDIWLDPRFRQWTIADEIATIRCPLLAVQGSDDRYGTLEQIRGIARRVPQARLLELPDCGHSPHVDRPQAVIDAARAFFQ